MSDGHSFGDRWREARPSKAMLFWSCAGCAVATMIIGFTWGGWVTGGTAQEMAAEAATGARAELAAAVCVDRFLNSPDAAGQLAQLRDTSAWQRDSRSAEHPSELQSLMRISTAVFCLKN